MYHCFTNTIELFAAELLEREHVENSSDDYDVVKASVQFVLAYEHSGKHNKKDLFNDGMREGLSTERVCRILNHQWLSGDVSYCYLFCSCLLQSTMVIHPLH